MSETLLQMHVLMDFLKLIIWTGQLIDERPISCVIVAPVGSGKTTVLQSLVCKETAFMTDLTSRPLSVIVTGPDEVTHILLGDFLSVFGHKESTVKLTLQTIARLTGETLELDPFGGRPIKPRQMGLITAIPPEEFNGKTISKHFNHGGFASRFVVLKYSYKASTIAAIHRYIAANKYAENGFKPFIMANTGKTIVSISSKISDLIKDFGMNLKQDELGFRVHRHLRALVKAEARRNCQSNVTMAHFERVQSYCEFFTSEGKAI